MEYEIGDEPQGLPDRPEGARAAGLDRPARAFRTGEPGRPRNRHDDASDEDTALEQIS